jgi:hypothetical protein
MLNVQPTLMWTGNGVHFIISQLAILLEEEEEFKKFDKPSIRFLRFEGQLLTNNKADPNHSRNISFGNCCLRIPGSLNSNQVRFNEIGEIIDLDKTPEAEVRIIQYWDGIKPSIDQLLPRYYIWLQAATARELDNQMEAVERDLTNKTKTNQPKVFSWIEKLLDTPLHDQRYYCVWFHILSM